ncbi:ABC transporter substrate-binding protein [Marinobacterium rhizophilum]|uniref:ABC transporter substrate-binding protein n=1 Tax=Marinobacterium rhizophilum TaxID=420402 RepID=A0ABY5HIN0_9GAMM|nr:ABC transporter substrate-binding protein [Marinobacterium rhizophilum]UTW11149.1 ABC transporter substrate-binding protein [Marinobacterium rhizophilum]
MSPSDAKRKLAAILSADVVEYSRLMGDDEQATVDTLKQYQQAIGRVIDRHQGRIVDAPGDNILAEFPSAVEAVNGAVEIQKVLEGRNLELPAPRRMEFRIGVNLGDVIEDDSGIIFGDGVNIAARMESLAEPGGICISSSVYDAVEGKVHFGYDFLGEQHVKNIAKPVSVYRVRANDQRSTDSQGASRPRWLLPALATLAGLGAGGLLVWLLLPAPPREAPAPAVAPVTATAPPVQQSPYLLVGQLVDQSGIASGTGRIYGQAMIDASNWINANGGVNGHLIDLDTVDTSYLVPRALEGYRKWATQNVLAIHGWSTPSTEALIGAVAEDEIPYFSASYAASLTDPTGRGASGRAAPYNFFYGPSYSDACRGLLQWARDDWSARGNGTTPRFVHMGENHPYPNAPKKACQAYATELGFEVLPVIGLPMTPGDFTEQCESLRSQAADYAYLANTTASVSVLLARCKALQVDTQFMVNIWGFDENVMQAAGAGADGVVWVMGAAKWGDDVPGMYTVQEISKMSDPTGQAYRPVHYIRGICSMFYIKEAMEWADRNGGISGPNIRQGLYQRQDWVPAGLEGVCSPASWTPEDHRGITRVLIYRSHVSGSTDAPVADLIERGIIRMERVYSTDIPRRPEWLGL